MLNYNELEKIIGYEFKDKNILEVATTHKSYAYEKSNKDPSCYNERLEFLGDAVLEHIISLELFKINPLLKEGVMSKKRSVIVCEASLSHVIKEKKLAKFVRLGKCEITTGGSSKDAILADMFEAILGAVYLDGGFENAKAVCLHLLKNKIQEVVIEDIDSDFKTRLQELLQKNGTVIIEYRLDKEEGKDHNKKFYSSVYLEGKKIGEGSGKTKKASEQEAAKKALKKLKD